MRISDWSSDVCSSDLPPSWPRAIARFRQGCPAHSPWHEPGRGGQEGRSDAFMTPPDKTRSHPYHGSIPDRGRPFVRSCGCRRQDRKHIGQGKGGESSGTRGGRRNIKKKYKQMTLT